MDCFRSLDEICCSYAFSHCRCPSGCSGSLAVFHDSTIPTAAFGSKAVVQNAGKLQE
jgi:hypothetical protein